MYGILNLGKKFISRWSLLLIPIPSGVFLKIHFPHFSWTSWTVQRMWLFQLPVSSNFPDEETREVSSLQFTGWKYRSISLLLCNHCSNTTSNRVVEVTRIVHWTFGLKIEPAALGLQSTVGPNYWSNEHFHHNVSSRKIYRTKKHRQCDSYAFCCCSYRLRWVPCFVRLSDGRTFSYNFSSDRISSISRKSFRINMPCWTLPSDHIRQYSYVLFCLRIILATIDSSEEYMAYRYVILSFLCPLLLLLPLLLQLVCAIYWINSSA